MRLLINLVVEFYNRITCASIHNLKCGEDNDELSFGIMLKIHVSL